MSHLYPYNNVLRLDTLIFSIIGDGHPKPQSVMKKSFRWLDEIPNNMLSSKTKQRVRFTGQGPHYYFNWSVLKRRNHRRQFVTSPYMYINGQKANVSRKEEAPER